MRRDMKVTKKEKEKKAAEIPPLSQRKCFWKKAADERTAEIVIIRTSDMGWPLS
jgi:hypothetical protein